MNAVALFHCSVKTEQSNHLTLNSLVTGGLFCHIWWCSLSRSSLRTCKAQDRWGNNTAATSCSDITRCWPESLSIKELSNQWRLLTQWDKSHRAWCTRWAAVLGEKRDLLPGHPPSPDASHVLPRPPIPDSSVQGSPQPKSLGQIFRGDVQGLQQKVRLRLRSSGF